MEIKNNEFSRKFETSVDGKPLSIEYAIQERKLFITKIILPEGETMENEVSEFIREVLKVATEKRLKVVPVHPKAAAFFRKNPAFKEMLPPGIRL